MTINVLKMDNAFKKLGLSDIHPIIKIKNDSCVEIFQSLTNHTSYYVEHYYDFINASDKTTLKGSSREKKIENLFSKSKPYFKFYYESEPESLYATAYLTKYLCTDLEHILDAFYLANLYSKFENTKLHKKSIFTEVELMRITTNHLIVMLTKCFCHIDMCEKISIDLFGEDKYGAFKEENGLEYHIRQIFKKIIKGKIYETWKTKTSSEGENKMASFIREMYYTKIYDFFSQKNLIDFIRAHPELTTIFAYKEICDDLLLGRQKTTIFVNIKILAESAMIKTVNFFYFVYLIDQYNDISRELKVTLESIPVDSYKLFIEV